MLRNLPMFLSRNRHVSADHRRLRLLRRTITVLAILQATREVDEQLAACGGCGGSGLGQAAMSRRVRSADFLQHAGGNGDAHPLQFGMRTGEALWPEC